MKYFTALLLISVPNFIGCQTFENSKVDDFDNENHIVNSLKGNEDFPFSKIFIRNKIFTDDADGKFGLNNNITILINNALEKIKVYMKEGNSTYKIPKLDPLDFNKTDLIHGKSIKLYGDINGQLNNLSNFNWEKLYACLFSMVLQIDVQVQDLNLEGDYNLDGSFYEIFPFYGSGKYRFEIASLNLTLTSQFLPTYSSDKPLSVNFTHINLNSYDGVKMNFGDIFGGNSLADIVNNFANDISSAIIEKIIGLLEVSFASTLKQTLNENMNNVTISDVINYLKSFPREDEIEILN